MKPVDLLNLTKNNEAAYKEMIISKTNHNTSVIFSVAGGFFLGYALGRFLFTQELKLLAMGTGIALIGASIPFDIGKRKHAKKGAIIYNDDLQKTLGSRLNFEIGFCRNGIGMKMGF